MLKDKNPVPSEALLNFTPSINSIRICKYDCPFIARGFAASIVNAKIRIVNTLIK
jgi:hypothetical protein